MSKKIVLPHEHGGWAMVSVPFLLGMWIGTPQWLHLPFFLAWLFLYLSSYPFLQAIKRKVNRGFWIRWGVLYGVLALLCLLWPLFNYPELWYFSIPLVLLLSINIWHTKRRSERAILNDLSAILIFSLGGAAAYLVAGGSWDWTMFVIILFSFLQFTGSAFFVKTVFRERTSERWRRYAKGFHVALPLIPILIGFPWMWVPYLFSTVRTFMFSGKKLRPMFVGIIEIVGVVQFLILTLLLM